MKKIYGGERSGKYMKWALFLRYFDMWGFLSFPLFCLLYLNENRVQESLQFWRVSLDVTFCPEDQVGIFFYFFIFFIAYNFLCLFFLLFYICEIVFAWTAGIVTRRPLVLQLHKTEGGSQEYAEFLHLPRRRFSDFCM